MIRMAAVSHDLKGDRIHSKCKVYWAFDGKDIVASCHTVVRFTATHPDFVWLTDLAVAPHARRRGIGRAMVERIRADHHPIPIRGHAEDTVEAIHFWYSMGCKMDLNNNFIIERD